MRVLIADDELVSRRILQNTLERLGHEVTVASNGIEAQRILLSPDGPRLAILDWMMPGADGLSVCRAVRSESSSYVYVIVLTSKARREDLAAAFDAEVDDFVTKPFDPAELRARLRSGERVLHLQTSLLEIQELLKQQATHDSLTGLWNRAKVLHQLELESGLAARKNKPMSVAMIDIDHFKSINDRFGHAAGDDVLAQAAARMRSSLRETDHISRYGGEEFLVVLPETDQTLAFEVAERLRRAIEAAPVDTDAGPLNITVSIGVATGRPDVPDVDTLIGVADAALYRAKAAGRNRTLA